MSGSRIPTVAAAVARRHVRKFLQTGGLFPSLLMPLIFLAAFAGGLSAISSTPNFGYPNYTSFVFVFVLLLGCSYGAIFSAIALSDDLEGHFMTRIMLAVPRRIAILLGLVLAGLPAALVISVVLFAIGAAVGMQVSANVLELMALLVLGLLLNVAVSLWGLSVAFRLRSAQAAPVMLLPLFAVLFMGPVYVPRPLLSGWIKTAASVNPVTPLLEAGRGLLIDKPVHVGLAFGSAAGLIALFSVLALTGLRKAERQA